MSVRGVLYVHSAPSALCPHIEWAVAGVLGVPVDLPWANQPAAPGTMRAELDWAARPGAAGGITTIEEIQELHKLGIHAALGMAIYTGRLNLDELALLNV